MIEFGYSDRMRFELQLSVMKKTVNSILFALPFLEGLGAAVWTLADRSESKNAFFLGLSPFRIGLFALMLALSAAAFLLFRRRNDPPRVLWLAAALGIAVSGWLLLFSRFPNDDSRCLIPLIVSRALPLILWLLLSSLQYCAALSLCKTEKPHGFALFCFLTALGVYWGLASYYDAYNWNVDLRGTAVMMLAAAGSAVLWQLLLSLNIPRRWKTLAGCLFFALMSYAVIRSTQLWMGRVNTPSKAYWNELAESFLAGRLDLIAPTGFHDLTAYNGKWYVPNPPMPALLLMPFAAALGSAEAINMSVYSAVLGALNAALVFFLLITAFTHPASPMFLESAEGSSYPERSLSVSIWVTVLFIFGSDLFWLATTGQMWFISQLVVTLFTLAAAICALRGGSPISIGILLGCAVLSRPNVCTVYLLFLGIWLWQHSRFPSIPWKDMIVWGLKSGIPVVISVGLLLLYNKLRFDDWMDFGYVTINGADWILESVREWGMFHPHFIKTNADVMLFGLPRLDFSGERFFFHPYVNGYSVFLMTPPLIYVFRSVRKGWFSVGAWLSVLVTVGLLLMYHNTGAEQIGYRYILDAAAPLILMTADGTRGKISPLFRLLTVFAVCLSFIAIYWWYLGRV